MSVEYGGAAVDEELSVSTGGHYRPVRTTQTSVNLGNVGNFTEAITSSKWLYHTLTVLAIGAGGALTGYLAGGNKRGAMIGAAAHLALFGGTVAVAGSQFSTTTRAAYGAAALGSSVGIGYLLWKRR